MGEQTPEQITDVCLEAVGNLSFLLSVIRCRENLSEDEEANIRSIQNRLKIYASTNAKYREFVVDEFRNYALEVTRYREALEKLEWVGTGEYHGGKCPACGGYQKWCGFHSCTTRVGHYSDCWLAEALREEE